MNMRSKLKSKLATGRKPQASGFEEKISNHELQTTRPIQRCKQPVACSLWLVAFLILLSLQNSAHAQASFPPVTINLNFPQHQRLKLDGGYEYISDGGMQGIILYRESEDKYIAYERTCSINNDAPVTVDGSGFFMKGCNSTFSFADGHPTSGPARQPLLKYRTSLNGQNLTITDEVVF